MVHSAGNSIRKGRDMDECYSGAVAIQDLAPCERHRPEAVELPQSPMRKGDKVRMPPERGSTAKSDQRLRR